MPERGELRTRVYSDGAAMAMMMGGGQGRGEDEDSQMTGLRQEGGRRGGFGVWRESEIAVEVEYIA